MALTKQAGQSTRQPLRALSALVAADKARTLCRETARGCLDEAFESM